MNSLIERIHDINVANGWRTGKVTTPTPNDAIARLALIATEVAEAIEEIRDGRAVTVAYFSDGGKPEGVPSEIADVIIRALDLADEWGIDIVGAINDKLDYNASRGHRHGGKVA